MSDDFAKGLCIAGLFLFGFIVAGALIDYGYKKAYRACVTDGYVIINEKIHSCAMVDK